MPASFVSYPVAPDGRSGWRQMTRKPEANSTDEIEITPEMIEAGARELARFDRDFDDPRDAAARIYAAMIETRPEPR